MGVISVLERTYLCMQFHRVYNNKSQGLGKGQFP